MLFTSYFHSAYTFASSYYRGYAPKGSRHNERLGHNNPWLWYTVATQATGGGAARGQRGSQQPRAEWRGGA